ncbi:MAG TPA: hypothetical protein VFG50_17905 [Rhodothermales bacterium]|nr:hypothetical protein [Rhodothermales bacterium]
MTQAGFDNPQMVGHGALLLGGIRISYFHSTNPHAPPDRGHQ